MTRQKGIALITVVLSLAILSAVVAEFAYNTRVDLEAAANARDQLRAEYAAKSGIQLARLLIKVQQSVLDPAASLIGPIQITDFAPYLMSAFGGEGDERAGLASMLGFDPSNLKGLGMGKNVTFSLPNFNSDDGRLNLNCGGGLNDQPRQAILYGVLSSMVFPPRYNRMFENEGPEGFINRDEVVRGIIDWADIDEARFEPPPTPSGGAEDYRYDTGRDGYRAHNNFFDTIEEVNLVRGVGDDFWGSFGEMFTVYGGCKINIAAIPPEHWPLVAAIIRGTVTDADKSNPMLTNDLMLAGFAQQIMSMSQLMGGFKSTQEFISMITDPAKELQKLGIPVPDMPQGIKLDPAKLNTIITTGRRRIYRLDSVGTIQRTKQKKIQVHIRAIWDTLHNNQNTISTDRNDLIGTWVYYRQD